MTRTRKYGKHLANRILKRARDFAEVKAEGVITKDVARLSLDGMGIDETGLDDMDRRILVALVEKFNVTWFSAVPSMHQALLARSKNNPPDKSSSLRFIRSCSAALPPNTMIDLEKQFGVPVLEAYGMTEAAHQMSSNPLPPSDRVPGSVGPGTGVEIAIMDE